MNSLRTLRYRPAANIHKTDQFPADSALVNRILKGALTFAWPSD